MKHNARTRVGVILSVFLALATVALGQVVVSKTEPIEVELDPGLSGADYKFDNVYDLEHAKVLKFEAMVTVRTIVEHEPPKLRVEFDWIGQDGGKVRSGPKDFDLKDPGPTQVEWEYKIDFCPKEVSLHLELIQGAVFAAVKGTFTHTCVPESESVVPTIGLLLVSFGVWHLRCLRA